MKLEKIISSKSEAFVEKLRSSLDDSDFIEISIKDSFGQNIKGKLVEVFFDQKSNSPIIVLLKQYEAEPVKIKLEQGEKIIAHKIKVFTV
jgi:small nuclear ribonucleoprotein (snRNP)-like protein